MIDPQAIVQMLQSLHQKNNPGDMGINVQTGQSQAPALIQDNKPGISMLGAFGGLGDTPNTQGGFDPSMLTRWNQNIMKQTGQGGAAGGTQQPLPWQQPQSQQLGQSGGSILKLLASFL